MVNEAIILAGGLGTRLRDEIPDLPKCMATVAGRPFLFHVINYWRAHGIQRFIFSLGYKHELIESWLKEQYATLEYACVVEETPLGTGGAIRLSLHACKSEQVLVVNGDTIFKVRPEPLWELHQKNKADCTVALKPMQDFDRYGTVELDERGKITAFREKQFQSASLINGGVYLLNRDNFLSRPFPEKFSFEKEYLELPGGNIYGHPEDAYFIDIGIPEDYKRADRELRPGKLDLKLIDKSWTIFIDRDGVINPEKKDDYIRDLNEFRFYDDVIEALKTCSEKFGKLVIVSNQRGVGRELMTEESLKEIHDHLLQEVRKAGGRIDAIYYCTAVDARHPDRKPNPGMALKAARDIPGIDLPKSIMVGNKPSDMLFGRYAGMYTVFVATTNPDTPFPHPDIDLRFNNLHEFSKAL